VEVVDESDVGKTTVLRPPQPWTRSGPQGQYELRVAPGRHQVRAWYGTSRRAESRWITVAREEADIRVDLELDRGDTLHGIARQASGKPATGVPLTLRPKPQGVPDVLGGHVSPGTTVTPVDIGALMGTMERTRSTTTGADGQFGFGEVEAGSYLLEPSDRSWRLADAARSVAIDVRAGQDNEVELVFAARAGVALRGRVVGPDGHAVRYARVSLSLFETTIVDPDGRFGFENLAPGDYEVRATSTDGALLCRSGAIAAGGSLVTLTLKGAKASHKRGKGALPCD